MKSNWLIFICKVIFIQILIQSSSAHPRLPEAQVNVESQKIGKNYVLPRWTAEENAKNDGTLRKPLPVVTKEQIHENDDLAEDTAGDAMGELFERLGRSDLIQSIMRVMARLNGGMGENEKESHQMNDQRIERRSAVTKSAERISLRSSPANKTLRIGQVHIMRKPQNDYPIQSPRSPTFAHRGRQEPEISESIDSRPLSVSSEKYRKIKIFLDSEHGEESFSQKSTKSKEYEEMAAIRDALGKEWKHALFGRSGLLTEIFNFVNDKRKEGLAKQAQIQAAPNLNDKSNDFSKILESLLRKAQTGDFDEPLPEIPFIGICNRLSCADIYKALDEFRKSEFFSNFQTAISLLNDPKGFDMIGELLANPELIENFTGPESIGELFGTTNSNKNEGKKTWVEIGENTDDENIGVDFTSMIDGSGGPKEIDAKPAPKIATSIDSGISTDYYSFVDEKLPASASGLQQKMTKEDKIILTPRRDSISGTNLPNNNGPIGAKPKDRFDERPLPEIAESIDARPTLDEDGPMTFEKNEFLPISPSKNGTIKIIMTPQQEVRVGQQRIVHGKEISHRNVATSDRGKTNENRAASRAKFSTSASITTTTPASITTRRNFRRDDDYYSMYYDDGANEERKQSANGRN